MHFLRKGRDHVIALFGDSDRGISVGDGREERQGSLQEPAAASFHPGQQPRDHSRRDAKVYWKQIVRFGEH